MWYVRVDHPGAQVCAPDYIGKSEIWDTFEMDQRPYNVVWFYDKAEAYEYYHDTLELFESLEE